MKPPVEHVRISAKGKDILIRIKKRTGLVHWNELCRIAYCRSLTNPTLPVINRITSNTALDIEWRTFAGSYHDALSSLTILRAHRDGIDINNKDDLASYFRAHIERGIASLQNIRTLSDITVNLQA
jgi:DNA sulfur modification protein DndE